MTPHPGGAKPRERRMLLAYALPAFAVALPTIPVFINLPVLYGVDAGLGLALTGYVLMIARVFDTVTDPLIGAASDRWRFRGNRRKPWIAAGALIAGVCLFKLLHPPAGIGSGYLLGWSVALYVGWTMVSVPYNAWGAELSADYNIRTRITSLREAAALIGILAAGAVMAATVQFGGTEARSIGNIALAAIGAGVLTIPWMLWSVPEPRAAFDAGPDKPGGPPQSAFTAGRAVLTVLTRNRPFLRLLSAWFINGLANGIPAALFFLYLEHVLGAGEKARPLFILTYFLAAVLAIPLWMRLSRYVGKHRAWCWAMVAACAAFAVVPFLPAGAYPAFAVVCVITGMSLGADLALPPAIQADVVDYGRLRTGRGRAGLQFALWGMGTKLALAVSVGLALPGVEIAGFRADAVTPAGQQALTVIYALVPVVIKILAIALVWRFPLTAHKHAVIRRRLARRAAGST